MTRSEIFFRADDSFDRRHLSTTTTIIGKLNNSNKMDKSIVPPKRSDDLILPPAEHSDDFCEDLTWFVRLVDCEIVTAVSEGAAAVQVKRQIVCQGTKNNLEKIRYAAKLFCQGRHNVDHISGALKGDNDTYFKDEVFIPNDRVHKLLGEEGKLLFKVRRTKNCCYFHCVYFCSFL